MFVEQGGQDVHVAIPCCVDELSVHRQRLDLRLELPPARTPILFCQLELRVRELRVRVGLAQFCETTFRLLAEPIKIGVIGKGERSGRRPGRLIGHDTPSFLERARPFQRPSSAVWARNEGYGRTVGGGLNPLRGPSAAPAALGRMVTHNGRWDKQSDTNVKRPCVSASVPQKSSTHRNPPLRRYSRCPDPRCAWAAETTANAPTITTSATRARERRTGVIPEQCKSIRLAAASGNHIGRSEPLCSSSTSGPGRTNPSTQSDDAGVLRPNLPTPRARIEPPPRRIAASSR